MRWVFFILKGVEMDKDAWVAMRATYHLCSCYPEHCERFDEHGLCWCGVEELKIGDNKIFVHQAEQ